MGKLRSNSQQSPSSAHRADSMPPSKLIKFAHTSQFISENSKRGNVLGVLRPYWLRVKESEMRLSWLQTMVRLELIVRDVEAYAKAGSTKLRSEDMKFKEQERVVLLGIMKLS